MERNHEQKVQEVASEIKRQGVTSKTREEWKAYFKNRDFLDDEVDIGFVVANAKIHTGPLEPKLTLGLLSILALVLFIVWIAIMFQFSIDEDAFQIGILPFFIPATYWGYVHQQRTKFFLRVLQFDFDAEEIKHANQLIPKWENLGSQLVRKRNKVRLSPFFKLKYDGRETYFGTYSYVVSSGKHEQTIHKSIYVQQMKKAFPDVHCLQDSSVFGFFKGQDIELESPRFNKRFVVRAGHPKEAFLVLNPRLMDAILRRDPNKFVNSFETVDDLLVIETDFHPIEPGGRLTGPILTFKEYKKAKKDIITSLDLITDFNDILHREIVDKGDQRSIAKEK